MDIDISRIIKDMKANKEYYLLDVFNFIYWDKTTSCGDVSEFEILFDEIFQEYFDKFDDHDHIHYLSTSLAMAKNDNIELKYKAYKVSYREKCEYYLLDEIVEKFRLYLSLKTKVS